MEALRSSTISSLSYPMGHVGELTVRPLGGEHLSLRCVGVCEGVMISSDSAASQAIGRLT